MVKTVVILGAVYKVHLKVPVSKDDGLIGRYGYCYPNATKIVIADLDTVAAWKNEPDELKVRQYNTTIRHEIIHAFLAESGLWGCSQETTAWAMNEEMVDWFALQYPKIKQVFEKLGCE